MDMLGGDASGVFDDLDDGPVAAPGPAEPDTVPFDVPYNPGPDAEDLSPDKNGGVMKEILKPGKGDELPGNGDRMVVHYTGRLAADGTKFDSSRDANRGPPFEFTLGKGEVIKAWDLGVASMKLGEVARLTCKAEFAYGKRGSPPSIPPDADLVFDVELLSWKGEDLSKAGDGGIVRRIINPATGFSTPNEGAIVTIHAVGSYGGRTFLDKECEFRLDFGEAEDLGLPRGVEEALYKFHKGEKASLKLAPAYGYGKAGKPEHDIPADAALVFEVELKDFVKAKDRWEMDNDEKLKHAALYKKLGTDFLQKGNLKGAEAKYKKALDYLDDGGAETDEEKKARTELLLAVRLNLGLVSLKLDECKSAVEHCSKALEIDPGSEKALFRRGQAFLTMREPEKAVVDFTRVKELNPDNKAAVQQIAASQRAIAELKQRDKRLFKKMFELYSAEDKAEGDKNDLPMPDTWEGSKDGGKPAGSPEKAAA